jgi:D-3-phosphoglycerate dehydrogenase
MPATILGVDRLDLSAEAVRILEGAGRLVWFSGRDERDLAEAARGADLLLGFITPVTRAVLEGAPAVRGYVNVGVGVDHVDLAAATDCGVPVTNTPGANANSVAEFAFGLILALVRRIPRADAMVRSGGWREFAQRGPFRGHELQGKVMGIIGLGAAGTHAARLGAAFGMRVIAHSPRVPPARAEEAGAALVPLADLLSAADVVLITCALTERTRGLIGADAIGRMRPSAVLVNVARGPIVDEAALVEALKTGRIAGAALDVYHQEPPPADHALLGLDNVIMTPHLAGVTWEAMERMYTTAAEEATRILRGEEPRHLVNREVLAKPRRANHRR